MLHPFKPGDVVICLKPHPFLFAGQKYTIYATRSSPGGHFVELYGLSGRFSVEIFKSQQASDNPTIHSKTYRINIVNVPKPKTDWHFSTKEAAFKEACKFDPKHLQQGRVEIVEVIGVVRPTPQPKYVLVEV